MVQEKQFRKRNAILEYLRSVRTHPSAEEVYAALKPQIPDLAMGTVYRNLQLFRQQGLVDCVATVDGAARYDASVVPHVHFVCNACGAVLDLSEMEIPASLSAAARQYSGGTVETCRLSFTGLCARCRQTVK